jgi:hypothetical protein
MPDNRQQLGSLDNLSGGTLDKLAAEFPTGGDFMLHLISHFGRMKYNNATKAHDMFQAKSGQEAKRASVLLRTLSELGHIDFETGKVTRVVARKPSLELTLRMLGNGSHEAVLCGARSKSLVESLRDKHGFREEAPTGVGVDAPKRYSVRGSIQYLEEITEQCDLEKPSPEYPVAWGWLHKSASVADWLDHIKVVSPPASTQDLPREGIFCPKSFNFGRNYKAAQQSGGFLRRKMQYGTQYDYFFREDAGHWYVVSDVDADWAKWQVICQGGAAEILFYNEQRTDLQLPKFCPLPGLLGRAVCMASGEAPTPILRSGKKFLSYSSVPPVVIKILEKKIGLKTKRS